MSEPFVFPKLAVGTRVTFHTDPSHAEGILGVIYKIGERTANIMAAHPDQGLLDRHHCAYIRDPDLVTNAKKWAMRFEDNESGVFELVEPEQVQLQLVVEVAQLRGEVTVLKEMLHILMTPADAPEQEAAPAEPETDQEPRRGPGRPRKYPLETAAVS